MKFESDTIASIASGYTDAGIGVIRVSGDQALAIAAKLFVPNRKEVDLLSMKTYTAHYGQIVDPETKERIDECILLYMKGPHSYTGEDTVEIDAHGGMYVCQRILNLLLRHGARSAEPGEYTKRAFLNGRMDLTQAEAVMDVIHANNEQALRVSQKQLSGSLKHKIQSFRDQIIHENAYIEYALDDPEHVSLDGFSEHLEEVLKGIKEQMKTLLSHAEDGRIMREGIKTAIVGKPNAGKSSLLNVLLGENRAIVTDVPGTTRDTLMEYISIGGIPFCMIDTAGIRDTEDVVEKIGVEKSKNSILDADLICYLVDASTPLTEEDEEIIALVKEKKTIVFLNKSDLTPMITETMMNDKIDAPILSTSMKTKKGLDQFEQLVKEMFFDGSFDAKEETYLTRQRHTECLESALESIDCVLSSIEMGMSEDFYTIDLMDAYEALGRIIGEAMEDDLVNRIFEEFCTGK